MLAPIRNPEQGNRHRLWPLTTDHCSCAVGPSALPCAGGFPPQRPPYTMPRWRRVAGVLSMPPVAHPLRAAKPSAVTTVGAGLVPAHSHPKIGLHPIGRGAPVAICALAKGSHVHYGSHPVRLQKYHLAKEYRVPHIGRGSFHNSIPISPATPRA